MGTITEILGHEHTDYIEALEAYLREKYAMDFAVDSLGGAYGTHDDTTLKAWCYCTEGEYANIKFYAEIGKEDLTQVKDRFLSVIAAGKVSQALTDGYGRASTAVTVIESGAYAPIPASGDLKEYLAELGTYFATSHIFVEGAQASSEACAKVVLDIAEQAKALELRELTLVVWFVEDLDAAEIQRVFRSTATDKLYDAYLGKTSKHAVVQLYGDRIATDYPAIVAALERK